MFDNTTIIAIAAAIGVLITAAMAILQLRNLVLQRKVNTIISLLPGFQSDMGREFNRARRLLRFSQLKDYADYVQRFGYPFIDYDNEVTVAFTMVANWYESIGLLYYYNYIDRNIIEKMEGTNIIFEWDYMKQIIIDIRHSDVLDLHDVWELFEFMAEDMRKHHSLIKNKIR